MAHIHGEVHWNELGTRDVEAAKKFYSETCGWTWADMDMPDGTYHVASIGETMVAGMWDIGGMPGMEEMPAHWVMYLAVDDADKAAAQTTALGGTVLRPAFDVPGVGRIVMALDPTGAMLGLMTPS